MENRLMNTLPAQLFAQLLFLEAEDPEKKDICIYINSGQFCNGRYGSYDAMQYIKPDVSTICIRNGCQHGCISAHQGQRKEYALPNAKYGGFKINTGGVNGQAEDIQDPAEWIFEDREKGSKPYSFRKYRKPYRHWRKAGSDNFMENCRRSLHLWTDY